MQAHHTTHGSGWWWSGTSGVGGKSLLNFFGQCSLQCLLFPAQGRQGSLPGNICSPCLERLPALCLGTLASAQTLPGNACQCENPAWACLQSLPAWDTLPVPYLGTLVSSLTGHAVQSLPGTLCQFPAWECLPMLCLGTLAVPAGNACQFPAWNACQFPAWDACQFYAWKHLLLGHCPQVSYFLMLIGQAWKESFCASWSLICSPMPCYFVSAMNFKWRRCKAKEKKNQIATSEGSGWLCENVRTKKWGSGVLVLVLF